MPQYLEAAKSDARYMAGEFLTEMVGNLLDGEVGGGGHTSEDYADYDDGTTYMHERVTDNRRYSLTESVALLDELEQYEETDSGLWEREKPRVAVGLQATYTYGNAVSALFRQIVKVINEDGTVQNGVAEVDNIDRYLDGLLETIAEGEDPVEVRDRVLERREAAVIALTEAVKAVIINF